ncbi:hypothetical protein L208DRAFT_1308273 [Tricholoma matsutake]|nr:hypothetical protein L208DRAFT_1308273 [Tricholoma matsutake 945]
MSSKKRKQANTGNGVEIPSKRSKQDGKRDKKSKKVTVGGAGFHVVKASLVVSIPPIFASNPRAGVEEMLDSMIMRYIPALQGVVLSHSNLGFLTKEAIIQADCPNLVCTVEFDATIWSPRIGMKLVGRINLCSPDHISILLHRTFNVSIPRHHIPTEHWEFEHGPAENDPEFGSGAQENAADENDSGNRASGEEDGRGRWVHRLTHEKLGGEGAFLEFTVIGLTVANEMLSLVGSLQDDPFSAEHIRPSVKTVLEESDIEDIEVERSLEEEIENEEFV